MSTPELRRLLAGDGSAPGVVRAVTPERIEVALPGGVATFPPQVGIAAGDRVLVLAGRLVPPSRRTPLRYDV